MCKRKKVTAYPNYKGFEHLRGSCRYAHFCKFYHVGRTQPYGCTISGSDERLKKTNMCQYSQWSKNILKHLRASMDLKAVV